MLSMLGFSLYILADTYFVAHAAGDEGLAVMNLCLPYYDLIYGFGQMIGTGGATRFSIERAQGEPNYRQYFGLAIRWALLACIPFLVIGAFFPAQALRLMGADAKVAAIGTNYARIFMLFSPAFTLHFTLSAFVRNDDDPGLAMRANLIGCFLNMLMDYVFMELWGWGMEGAAIATSLAPLISFLICLKHFKRPDCSLGFCKAEALSPVESIKRIRETCRLGISPFVVQISEGVITTEFNAIIVRLAGTPGLAAYSIISNYSIAVLSVLGGIGDGAQPLISRSYGEGKPQEVRQLRRMSLVTAEILSLLVFAAALLNPDRLIAVFNGHGSQTLVLLARDGIRIYFAGFLFAAFNIVLSAAFSAANRPKDAGIISVMRGFAVIIPAALLLSACFGMTGVWASFAAAEGITAIAGMVLLQKSK